MISRSLLALGALAILVGTPIETDARPLRRLAVEERGTEHAWVSWGSEPVFAYGLSPQNLLTCLPPEGAPDPDLDVLDFAEWAEARGITIVRSYPPSSIQSPRGLDAFERAASDSTRFDLTRFDPRYFERLRDACITLQTHDVIVHLQLWQAVAWKKEWPRCYYHPDHNVNPEIAEHAGPGEFVVDPGRNPRLIEHQRAWIRHVLDATGDLGNVFYDVMNEIGNGTGVNSEWVEAMLDEIESWERETGLEAIVGLNDEGQDRAETGWALSNPRLDVAFLDLGRYDQHVEARARHLRPTFGIRNIDWNPDTGRRRYFAIEDDLSIQPDSALRSRSSRMFWRMACAGVSMNAGYADYGRLAYRTQTDCAGVLPTLRFAPELAGLVAPRRLEVVSAPTEYAYAIAGTGCLLALVETMPGTAGEDVAAGELVVRGPAEWTDELATSRVLRAFDLSVAGPDDDDPDALVRVASRELPPPMRRGADEWVFSLPVFRDGLAICWGDARAVPVPSRRTAEARPPLEAPHVRTVRTRAHQAFLWAKGNTRHARYEWQRRAVAAGWTDAGVTPTYYLADPDLESGTTYEYRVRALGDDGVETAWSALASATPGQRDWAGDVRRVMTRWPELRIAVAAVGAALLLGFVAVLRRRR